MLRAVSTYVYVKERLHPGLLDELVKAGAQAIEIFAARQHFDYANRKQHVREIADWFRSSGIPLNSVHAPLYADYEWGRTGSPPVNIASTDRATRIEAMDEIKRALEVAEHIPYRFLVQHIGNPNDSFDEKKFEAAMTSIEHLRAFAKPLGVRILVENIPNELSSAERLLQFEELTHLKLNYVFDTGHAHMNEGVENAFQLMKDRIRSTHIHDNDGKNDVHLFPFLGEGGSIDWANTMRLFRSCGDQFPLCLELRERPEFTTPLNSVKQIFDKLEEL